MSANIENLIKTLGENEARIVEDYIHSLAVLSRSAEDSKQLKYFKLLVENKNITEKELSTTLNTKDFKSLKRHLLSKIHDALLQTKHISNSDIFNDRERILFELKKKILLVKILHRSSTKGRNETIEHLLQDIIKTAKENEVFDVLVEALSVQKYSKGVRSGIEEFEKINLDICFYNACIKATQNASDAYYRLVLNNSFVRSLSESDLKKHIHDSITTLENDFKNTKSQGVNYYLHILKMAYYEKEKDYFKSIQICKKLLTLVKNNPVIYRTDRMGFILDNMSQFKTFAKDYKSAIKDAKSAQSFYIVDSFNYLTSIEQEFHAYFYDGQYHKAQKCIELLSEHLPSDAGEFRKSKFIYFQACNYFQLKKYKEALLLLNSSLEIEKDKTRWNISLRILNIMIFIELDKIDEASTSLESLRKYIQRTNKNGEIKPRKLLIVKVLRELEKNGFKFDSNNSIATKAIKELANNNGNSSWEHYTSELIPFDKWLRS